MFNKNLTTRRENANVTPWYSFRDDLMDIFDRFSQDLTPFNLGESKFVPKVEVQDLGNSYQICAEVPGMSEKDINITLENNQLILEGEKRSERKSEERGRFHSEISYGHFYRAIPLSEDIDTDKVNASYKDGVLKVDLKKRPETERKAKRISINQTIEGKSKVH